MSTTTIIFFDIDHTIVEFKRQTGEVAIRPHVKETMWRIIQSGTHIGIYTAGNKPYANMIAYQIFGELAHHFKFIFSEDDCFYSANGLRVIKNFTSLKTVFPQLNQYKKIYIIDDNPQNIVPAESAIPCERYHYENCNSEVTNFYFRNLFEKIIKKIIQDEKIFQESLFKSTLPTFEVKNERNLKVTFTTNNFWDSLIYYFVAIFCIIYTLGEYFFKLSNYILPNNPGIKSVSCVIIIILIYILIHYYF